MHSVTRAERSGQSSARIVLAKAMISALVANFTFVVECVLSYSWARIETRFSALDPGTFW